MFWERGGGVWEGGDVKGEGGMERKREEGSTKESLFWIVTVANVK